VAKSTWGAPLLEVDPADVRAVGIAAQVAKAVVVYAVVGAGVVLVPNAVGGRAAAEANPAEICGIDVARADVFADDGAVGHVPAAFHPAEIGGVGVVVGVRDGGARPRAHSKCEQQRC
jgi:hypothetical protein